MHDILDTIVGYYVVNTLFPFLTFSSHAMFIERFGIFPLDIATLETK